MKYIIDVDTGIDDALALLYFLADKNSKDLIGITTCSGNVEINKVIKNTLGVLALANKTIPVYRGSSTPLKYKKFTHAYNYHGKNGLSNIELTSTQKVEELDAVSFIQESIKRYNKNLTIVCLAPLTNLARVITEDEEFAKNVGKIVIMGGAVKVPGNQTKYAEFNFYQDSHAAKIVLENCNNIYLVPLDVTGRCVIKPDDINKFKGSKVGRFINDAINNWYKIFGRPKGRKFELYDPLAISAIFGKFLKFERSSITILTSGRKRGYLSCNESDNSIYYADGVCNKEFVKDLTNKINLYE